MVRRGLPSAQTGGRLLLKTPNRYHYVATIARWAPRRFHRVVHELRAREPSDTFPALYRCNTRRAIHEAAELVGFEIEVLESWEGRPEYLRWSRLGYLMGLCWERAVNRSQALMFLRAVHFASLLKPGPKA